MTAAIAMTLDQAVQRLDDIECHPAKPRESLRLPIRVALPASYSRATRRHYPLLLLLESPGMFGGAVEMSRLMAQTSEVRECIVVGIDGAHEWEFGLDHAALMLAEVLRWCQNHYRVSGQECALFGEGIAGTFALYALITGMPGVSSAIVVLPDRTRSLEVLKRYDNAMRPSVVRHLVLLDRDLKADNPLVSAFHQFIAAEQSIALTLGDCNGAGVWSLTDLLYGLRKLWGLPPRKMLRFIVMRQVWLRPLFFAMAPLVRRFMRPAASSIPSFNPHRMHSTVLQRDFEVFVSLPDSCSSSDGRIYPAVVVLDANIQFSTAVEAARAMARSGAMAETIVIGVGTPRSEGIQEYTFRRFEEFSPPADGYRFDDEMGQFFRGLFAMRGQDARQRLGQAPGFLKFLHEEMLPRVMAQFPIDAGKMALVGHSAGGTFACYAMFDEHSPFSEYAAFSPGIGISGLWLERKLSNATYIPASTRKVLLTIGAEEEEPEPTQASGISRTAGFSRRLSALGGPEVSFQSFDGESHTSTYPRALMKAYATLFQTRG